VSIYRRRFSRFPRTVTQDDVHLGRTRQLGSMGTPTGTRDQPMPVPRTYPNGWQVYDNDPAMGQPPGPFVGRDLPPHLYPPRNWENLDVFAYQPVPAIGSSVTILTFHVPIGRNGVINKVANNFIGGGFIAGTADIVWRILVDGAAPPGASNYQFITDSLGSQANPVAIAGFRIFENQTLTVVGFNNPGGLNGGIIVSGQQVGARLLGHLFPRDLEYLDLWV